MIDTLEQCKIKNDELMVPVSKVDSPTKVVLIGKDYEEAVTKVQTTGRIVKMGFLCEDFGVGSMIMFPDYAGREIAVGGVNYLIMGKENVLAVIE